MPEVQKPVLEHAAPETQNPQVTGVTVATDFQAGDVRKTDRIRLVVECIDPGVAAVFRAASSVSPEAHIQRDIIITAARWAEFLGSRLDSYAAINLDSPVVAELVMSNSSTFFS